MTNDGPVEAGQAATVTVQAIDTTTPSDTLAYAFDFDGDGTYEVGPQTGNSASFVFATAGDHVVNVLVIDNDGGTTTATTTVAVYALSNQPPAITSNGGGDSADLSAPEGTTAVTTVIAADPDNGDTLTFTLAGGADQRYSRSTARPAY